MANKQMARDNAVAKMQMRLFNEIVDMVNTGVGTKTSPVLSAEIREEIVKKLNQPVPRMFTEVGRASIESLHVLCELHMEATAALSTARYETMRTEVAYAE